MAMFNKVVVANRGAVAARVIRALRQLGVASVAVYSEADAGAAYLAQADDARCIGPGPARESYLNQDALLKVVAETGADGLHPGYGFLSENAGFCRRVGQAGATFIGPSATWLSAMGDKIEARTLMARHGMPVARGTAALGDDAELAAQAAEAIGFPVLIKPSGGGGGIGMLAARSREELASALSRARSMAERSFGQSAIYLEKLIERPRHIEFQMLGDRHGGVRHLFERDCSLQRRHQKILEEGPAPGLKRGPLDELAEHAAGILRGLGYDNIGTVEMLLGQDGTFGFLEMNTRLQVEHAVTEEITGVDLVKAQIRAAAGEKLADILPAALALRGHAIEARVYAEDPKTFFPSPGPLQAFRPPQGPGIRIETGYCQGMSVTPFYDPLIAKVIAHASDRPAAIAVLRAALEGFEIAGIKTNIPFLLSALASPDFQRGDVHTGLTTEIAKQAEKSRHGSH